MILLLGLDAVAPRPFCQPVARIYAYIDPTLFPTKVASKSSILHSQLYQMPDIEYSNWVSNYKDVPEFDKLVKIEYCDKKYILLHGRYNWLDRKKLGYELYQLPQKNLWYHVYGYMVPDEKASSFIEYLSGKDFMGNWMPEPEEYSSIYNRELYWSEAYKFFKSPSFGNSEWISMDIGNETLEVLLPVREYYSGRKGDEILNNGDSVVWLQLCEDIYNGMNLSYAERKNSCLLDKAGNLVCFDSLELLNEPIGYFIEETYLKEYLKNNNMSLIWTCLSEKQIIGSTHTTMQDMEQRRVHYSATYLYNCEEGKIERNSGKVYLE